MWSLFKTLVFIAIVAALGYFVFFVELGGATLAQHSREVWESRLVQDKVQRVSDDVQGGLANRIPEKARDKAKEIAAAKAADNISEEDRKALDKILEKSLQ